MKTLKALILIGFTVLLIIATIDLATQTKSDTPQITRIDAPINEYRQVKTATKSVSIPTEQAQTEIVEVEIKSEQANAPALEMMWDLPIRAEVQLEIEAMCAARDIDVAVIVAMIYHESRYDEKAIGDNGKAFGLMQIQPRWHEERIKRLGVTDLLDGTQNVLVGIDYLDELLDIYNGDYSKALTAYNTGKYRGVITAYANIILQEAKKHDLGRQDT